MSYETTPKGDAFVRYYFIDRGTEEDLSLDQAQEDFEQYIYRPIKLYVLEEMIDAAVSEALDEAIDPDTPVDQIDEQDMLDVAQYIGMGFLLAYRDLYSKKSD